MIVATKNHLTRLYKKFLNYAYGSQDKSMALTRFNAVSSFVVEVGLMTTTEIEKLKEEIELSQIV